MMQLEQYLTHPLDFIRRFASFLISEQIEFNPTHSNLISLSFKPHPKLIVEFASPTAKKIQRYAIAENPRLINNLKAWHLNIFQIHNLPTNFPKWTFIEAEPLLQYNKMSLEDYQKIILNLVQGNFNFETSENRAKRVYLLEKI